MKSKSSTNYTKSHVFHQSQNIKIARKYYSKKRIFNGFLLNFFKQKPSKAIIGFKIFKITQSVDRYFSILKSPGYPGFF